MNTKSRGMKPVLLPAFCAFLWAASIPNEALAESRSVVVDTGGSFPVVNLRGIHGAPLSLKLSCYGTNVRTASNTLSPSGTVDMSISFASSISSVPLKLRFPAALTFPKLINRHSCYRSVGLSGDQNGAYACENGNSYSCSLDTVYDEDNLPVGEAYFTCKDAARGDNAEAQPICRYAGIGSKAGYSKDNQQYHIADCYDPGVRTTAELNSLIKLSGATGLAPSVKSAASGLIDVSLNAVMRSSEDIQSISFEQEVTSSDELQSVFLEMFKDYLTSTMTSTYTVFAATFKPKTGEIIPRVAKMGLVKPGSGNYLIDVSLPGQDGYCGSYHSPLMLFFDDRRPEFSGKSRFPIQPDSLDTWWVEAGAPGYFLAIDTDGSRRIRGPEQLFGDGTRDPNGFEALARLDSNSDRVIDAKDEKFASLVLWQDANGNGISERGEVRTLGEMGVVSISLSYRNDFTIHFGERATVPQQGTFRFRKKGARKEVEGRVFDVWFASP